MENNTQVAFAEQEVFTRELPDLTSATAAPLPINGEYWTPMHQGESKRMFFKELRTEVMIDKQTGEDIELLVAYFVENKNGKNQLIRQAGIRLTSVFDSHVKAGTIVPGMPFEITYNGKQRTTSGNQCDTWSIIPLATK